MIVLEDLDLAATTSAAVDKWAEWIGARIFDAGSEWETLLQQHLCIVHDDVLSFLLETATQVTARIRLKEDSKTVERGGLWYEEALPAETILYGLVVATPVKKTNLQPDVILNTIQTLTDGMVQLGGAATVGRGLCQLSMNEEPVQPGGATDTTNEEA